MLPGIKESVTEIDDMRKTALISMELHKLGVDVACLQETRLPDSGSLKEDHYTFFWKGKPADERRDHGVGFAVKNSLLAMTEPPSDGSERILSLRLCTTAGFANLICVYAPTLISADETKEQFYADLDRTISGIPRNEFLYILGDFNARVGDDHESWPTCLGHHGIGRMNDNGQRVLELCTQHRLCISNSFYKTKPQHKVAWRHPRSNLIS